MTSTLLIYTGGTIGMIDSANGLVPDQHFEQALRLSLKNHAIDAEFDFFQLPDLIDSSNLQPQHWQGLTDVIFNSHSQYQSYVILHGTDTMAYSSAFFSFACATLDSTVVFTGSQIPLQQAGSDAIDNLRGALSCCQTSQEKAAIETLGPKVSLFFGGLQLQANRASKASSTDFVAFSGIEVDAEFNRAPEISTQVSQASAPALGSTLQQQLFLQPHSVQVVHFHPGLHPSVVAAAAQAPGVKALILYSFGAGNVPSQSQEVMAVLQQASEASIAMINISQCQHGGVSQGLYEAGSVLSQYQVTSGGDMNLEAAVAKAHYLIARGLEGQPLAQAMTKNLCNEMS